MSELPDWVNPDDMERDPAKRPNHWYHAQSDTVFAMEPGWRPPSMAKANTGAEATTGGGTASVSGENPRSSSLLGGTGWPAIGQRVLVIASGQHGTISDDEHAGDMDPHVDVLLDGVGATIAAPPAWIRPLNRAEIEADEAALAQGIAGSSLAAATVALGRGRKAVQAVAPQPTATVPDEPSPIVTESAPDELAAVLDGENPADSEVS